MFALFKDDSTIIMGDRRLRSLRLLNQWLWIFALFEDARLQPGTRTLTSYPSMLTNTSFIVEGSLHELLFHALKHLLKV